MNKDEYNALFEGIPRSESSDRNNVLLGLMYFQNATAIRVRSYGSNCDKLIVDDTCREPGSIPIDDLIVLVKHGWHYSFETTNWYYKFKG